MAKPGPRTRPLVDRFWEKVQRPESGCWVWTSSTDKDGYGQIGNDIRPRTMLKAHRVSWELAFGPVPEGLCVCHRCDNPPCVRPDHLFLGTTADNNGDMNQKGRNVFQTRNPSTKLSPADVVEIRRRRQTGERLASIAADYGVHEPQISRIANRIRRGDVP